MGRAFTVLGLTVLTAAMQLTLGVGSVGASGPHIGIADQARISSVAGYNTVNVVLTAKCTGGSGFVAVTVTQTPQQSGNGLGDTGYGSELGAV